MTNHCIVANSLPILLPTHLSASTEYLEYPSTIEFAGKFIQWGALEYPSNWSVPLPASRCVRARREVAAAEEGGHGERDRGAGGEEDGRPQDRQDRPAGVRACALRVKRLSTFF